MKNKKFLISLFFGCWIIVFFPFSVGCTSYFLKPGGTEQFTSVQTAIDLAQEGDTIILEPGQYKERIIIKGKKDISVRPVFKSDEKLINIYGTDTGRGIIEIIDSSGITIEGLRIAGSQQSPKHLLYVKSSSVLVEGNRIEQARSVGVYISNQSNVELVRNQICCNYKGVLFYQSSGKLIYNVIYNNSHTGVQITNKSNAILNHNTFYNNQETGALIEWGSKADILNNIFSSNGLALKSSPKITADFNLFHSNSKNYSGVGKADHIVLEDPMFRDPVKSDFSLLPTSPAIGAASDGLNLGAIILN